MIALHQEKKFSIELQRQSMINVCPAEGGNQPVIYVIEASTLYKLISTHINIQCLHHCLFAPKVSKSAPVRNYFVMSQFTKLNMWRPRSCQQLISNLHTAAFYSCSLFIWCHTHADRQRLDVKASLLVAGSSAPWTAPLADSRRIEKVGETMVKVYKSTLSLDVLEMLNPIHEFSIK